ncbi:MAG TPA: Gfo/Idh/MocA family oxidoreductase [Candidatus Hydrogenedentes bacterium]|nr:Gfo/Idh/MocA family oxidoreductase [Candidatus Hydrogenedentota bacterium]HOL77327.1 Gfo/Idh/MocA family oxidoreductase [Candidatus Hydrogenedentota bacterium]HPO85969.1 Gfo/Idh/MocA family oxidoreductase [Candidatus Hydrogenedentota bacterium]
MKNKTRPVRVAVVGATGIGRHHANWWHLEGAEVCAFVGRTAESIEKTGAMLLETFRIPARGYTSLPEMLTKEQPEIVDVCSPNPCHYGHTKTALEAGCSVLCEKPFVYEPGASRETLLEKAQELVEIADTRGLRLGVCTQYSAGTGILKELYSKYHGTWELRNYCGHLESPAKGRSPDPRRVWVDLSPHPISVLLQLCPDLEIDWDTVETHFSGYAANVRFMGRSHNKEISCTIMTGNRTDPPQNIREFIFNDFRFLIEGERDPQGIYNARVETSLGNYVCEDFMRLLIRDFLAGRPTADGRTALRNLDLMMRFMEKADKQITT